MRKTTGRPAGANKSEKSVESWGVDVLRILVNGRELAARSGLVRLLVTQPDFHVVGETVSPDECLRKYRELNPHLVVFDLARGDPCVSEVLGSFGDSPESLPAVLFIGDDDEWLVLDAIDAGARGYIFKQTSSERLCEAVRVVGNGESYLDPTTHSALIATIEQKKRGRRSGKAFLTAREKTILQLLARGKSNREIADTVFVSQSTVKSQVSAIIAKLHASNRTEAVSVAVERGLVVPHARDPTGADC